MITAEQVHQEAIAQYGADNVGAYELGEVYQSMLRTAERIKGGVYYTPQPLANFVTRFSLEQALDQAGPEPGDVLKIVACDPSCGAGMFLAEAAHMLSTAYAARFVGGQPPIELVVAVMPKIVLTCVFGLDIDPVAVDLARLSLSLQTGGFLPATALERHVICGDPLAGDSPPAMEDRLHQPAA